MVDRISYDLLGRGTEGRMMQEDYRMDPHILRWVVDAESEEVVTITAEGTRALLVFADPEDAQGFISRTPGAFQESEAVEVSPGRARGGVR